MTSYKLSTSWFLTATLLALGLLRAHLTDAFIKVPTPEALEKLLGFDIVHGGLDKKLLDPIDMFMEDILPTWFDQSPNNQNGTRPEFREYALNDVSNDDAAHLTSQQLITRSGFRYEQFDVFADDGYVTQLTRLINPRANAHKLRQPPVLMEHGGTIDPTAYLLASSIQHVPESWPRSPSDGPIRSWNRSLAFTLANNGFDVWLAETRGSNDNNMRHIRTPALEHLLTGINGNSTLMDQLHDVMKSISYWTFTQDDIIAYELKSHIDAVLKLTANTKLNLMTFSLSTPTSLAFLGEHPDYADKVHGYVSMAPIISGKGTSKFINLIFKTICPLMPDEIGTLLITDILLTQTFRELLMLVSRNKEIRYILFKSVSTLLMGASPKWQTLLDLNLIGHLFRQLSFREFKQMCQQMSRNKLQKFDYGPIKNQLMYKQLQPPEYNISNIHLQDWIIVSGSNDALSTPQVIDHLLSIVNPKPIAHIVAPNFNHLDLFAGWGNDIYVNEPILRYFERMSSMPGGSSSEYARNLDLQSILPTFLHPEKVYQQVKDSTKQFVPTPSIGPKDFVEALTKGIRTFIESVATSVSKGLLPKFPLMPTLNSYTKDQTINYDSLRDQSEPVEAVDTGSAANQKEAKNIFEKTLTNLKPNAFGKLMPMTNVSQLLDTKKMVGGLGELLGKLRIDPDRMSKQHGRSYYLAKTTDSTSKKDGNKSETRDTVSDTPTVGDRPQGPMELVNGVVKNPANAANNLVRVIKDNGLLKGLSGASEGVSNVFRGTVQAFVP